MTPPLHCDKPARPYARLYGPKRRPHSIEHGFMCSVCGEIRLSVNPPRLTETTTADDLLREEGIKFDESLTYEQINNARLQPL